MPERRPGLLEMGPYAGWNPEEDPYLKQYRTREEGTERFPWALAAPEMALTMGTGLLAMPAAGWEGLLTAGVPREERPMGIRMPDGKWHPSLVGNEPPTPADIIERRMEAGTFMPRSQVAQEGMVRMGQSLEPLLNDFTKAGDWLIAEGVRKGLPASLIGAIAAGTLGAMESTPVGRGGRLTKNAARYLDDAGGLAGEASLLADEAMAGVRRNAQRDAPLRLGWDSSVPEYTDADFASDVLRQREEADAIGGQAAALTGRTQAAANMDQGINLTPVDSMLDAERRWNDGEELYAFHEMDEQPSRIESLEQLRSNAYDQIGSAGRPVPRGPIGQTRAGAGQRGGPRITLGGRSKDTPFSDLPKNPLNEREVLFDGAAVQLEPFGDQWYLQSIRSTEKGGGSKAMRQITDAADREGKSIRLFPEPFGDKAMSQADLIKWYENRGFRQMDDGSMVRSAPEPGAAPLYRHEMSPEGRLGIDDEVDVPMRETDVVLSSDPMKVRREIRELENKEAQPGRYALNGFEARKLEILKEHLAKIESPPTPGLLGQTRAGRGERGGPGDPQAVESRVIRRAEEEFKRRSGGFNSGVEVRNNPETGKMEFADDLMNEQIRAFGENQGYNPDAYLHSTALFESKIDTMKANRSAGNFAGRWNKQKGMVDTEVLGEGGKKVLKTQATRAGLLESKDYSSRFKTIKAFKDWRKDADPADPETRQIMYEVLDEQRAKVDAGKLERDGRPYGAPKGMSYQKRTAMVRKYADRIERGLSAFPEGYFYREGRGTISELTPDVADQRRTANQVQATSSQVGPSENVNYTQRARDQYEAGAQINTTIYPNTARPTLERMAQGQDVFTGYKRDRYGNLLTPEGARPDLPESALMPPNDRWEFRAAGFDTVPTDPKNVAYMDKFRQDALDLVNKKRAERGERPLILEEAQELHWAVIRAESEGRPLVLNPYSDQIGGGFDRLEYAHTYEATPGVTAGQTIAREGEQGLLDLFNQGGRDPLVSSMGGTLQRPVSPHMGYWDEQLNQGQTSRSFVSRTDTAGLDPASANRVRSTEAIRAFALGQDAFAGHVFTPISAAKDPKFNGVTVRGQVDGDDLIRAIELGAEINPDMVVVHSPQGLRAWIPGDTSKKAQRQVQDFANELDFEGRTTFGKVDSQYDQLTWANTEGDPRQMPLFSATKDVLRILDEADADGFPGIVEKADSPETRAVLGRIADKYDELKAAGLGVPNEKLVKVLRTWADEGLPGVREMVRKGLAPAAVLGILAGQEEESLPGGLLTVPTPTQRRTPAGILGLSSG